MVLNSYDLLTINRKESYTVGPSVVMHV